MGEAKYLICLSWQVLFVLDHCGGFIFRHRINLYYLFGSVVLGETFSKRINIAMFHIVQVQTSLSFHGPLHPFKRELY